MKSIFQLLLITIAYLSLFSIFYLDPITKFSQFYFGGGESDPGLYIYLIKENTDWFFGSRQELFSPRFFFPFGSALAFSDNFLLPSFLASLLSLYNFSEIQVYNSILVIASILNGISAFYLSRFLGSSKSGALISGASFMFCYFFSMQWHHPQLLFGVFLPLTLLFSLKQLVDPCFKNAFLICLFIFGAFLSSVYICLFSTIIITSVVMFSPIAYLLKIKLNILEIIKTSSFAIIIWAWPFYEVIKPYLLVRNVLGAWPKEVLSEYSFSLSFIFGVPNKNYLWGEILGHKFYEKGFIFPTITGLCLIAIALIRIFNWKSSNHRPLLLILPFIWIFFFGLSLGLNNEAFGVSYPQVILPFYWFFEYVPGFNAIRVPGRFTIVVNLINSQLIGLGATYLLSISSNKFHRIISVFLSALIICFLMVELKVENFFLGNRFPDSQVHRYLNNLKDKSPAVALPVFLQEDKRFPYFTTSHMNNLQRGGREIVNGYSGKMPKFQNKLSLETRNFPDKKSLNFLGKMPNLRYIIYDFRLSQVQRSKKSIIKKCLEFVGKCTLLNEDSQHILFEINPEVKIADNELYFKPNTNQKRVQELSFYGPKSKTAKNLQLKYYRKIDEKKIYINSIDLPLNGRWNKIPFELPKSSHQMLPDKIIFDTKNHHFRDKILVKR